MKPQLQPLRPVVGHDLKVAIAGNPNSGKSTVFNALTGGKQHVGNYPGVTVEKRDGRYRHAGREVQVRDLPGTYSLASHAAEERIAREDLIHGGHDVVIVVVDSMTLRRSLVLLLQVMQLGVNPVLCLNMADEAVRAGLLLDVRRLADLLRPHYAACPERLVHLEYAHSGHFMREEDWADMWPRAVGFLAGHLTA